MITLNGHLDNFTYYNQQNHFTIARFKTDQAGACITIVGFMPCVNPGEPLRIKGVWETHPQYGEQFRVANYKVTLPSSGDIIKSCV